MAVFFAALVVFALSILGLSASLILRGRPLSRGCSTLGSIDGLAQFEHRCRCVNYDKCPKRRQRGCHQ